MRAREHKSMRAWEYASSVENLINQISTVAWEQVSMGACEQKGMKSNKHNSCRASRTWL